MSDIAYRVFAADKTPLGEVRSLTSAQWLEIYDDVGELKLVCGVTALTKQLLQRGHLLQNTDRPHLLARICSVVIDDDAKAAKMTVRAKMTVQMWDDRVLMYTAELADSEQGILNIASDNQRELPCSVAAAKGIGTAISKQISWGSVLDAAINTAQEHGLGLRNIVDEVTLAEVLEVYKGVDRTNPAGADYVGYIGRDSGTLGTVKITDADNGAKNVAIVCGDGEGAARTVVRVDLPKGAPARELYVDARNISRKYTVTAADGTESEATHTDAEYEQLLRAEGMQALLDNGLTLTLSAELQQRQMLLGRDYDLGDILPMQLTQYGLYAKVRIQRITMVTEANKSSITAALEILEVLETWQ